MAGQMLSDYLNENTTLSEGEKHSLQTALATLGGLAVGSAVGDSSQAGLSGAVISSNAERYNRQLHPNEMNWIKANAARFAEEQGISQAEAEQRLAQQAAKDIDVLWFLITKDGADSAASAFLSAQKNQTFVDSTGSIQQYFTAKDNEFWTPRTYAKEAYNYDKTTGFVKDNLQSGVIRTPWQGFSDKAAAVADYVSENPLESAKTASVAIYEGVTDCASAPIDCASAPIDCGKAFISNIWTTGGSSLKEIGGNLVGKDELAINSLYGQNMSAEMAVIPTAQAAFTALEVVGAGKVAKAIGKETVEAVGKASLHTKQIFDEALKRGWDGRLDDYVYNPADGTFTGTGGGKLINTGQTDPISGDYVYQRIDVNGKAYGSYVTVTAEGKQFVVNKPEGLKRGISNVAPEHHICTNKNCISSANGGPWTPRFEVFFNNADLSIEGALNKVRVINHRGPHPEEYHRVVYQRLMNSTLGLEPHSEKYRLSVENTLNDLSSEIVTPGTYLNKLITGEK